MADLNCIHHLMVPWVITSLVAFGGGELTGGRKAGRYPRSSSLERSWNEGPAGYWKPGFVVDG